LVKENASLEAKASVGFREAATVQVNKRRK